MNKAGHRGSRWAPALIAALALVLAGATAARAQSYPAKPIRIIVPAAPGGPADAVARIASQFVAKLGQPVVVENRSGAGGALGARDVANASPDGYTLLAGNTSTLTVIPAVSANAGYDPRKDFVPVALMWESYQFMASIRRSHGRRPASSSTTPRPIPASSLMLTPASAACRICRASCSWCVPASISSLCPIAASASSRPPC
jgi:hypothetical protein